MAHPPSAGTVPEITRTGSKVARVGIGVYGLEPGQEAGDVTVVYNVIRHVDGGVEVLDRLEVNATTGEIRFSPGTDRTAPIGHGPYTRSVRESRTIADVILHLSRKVAFGDGFGENRTFAGDDDARP